MAGMTFQEIVEKANPYTPSLGSTTMKFEDPIIVEQQVHLGNWAFKGVPYYIEKALKIPYTYKDAHGVTIEDYLLIGFAGGGAY
jgi:hypothetical protein